MFFFLSLYIIFYCFLLFLGDPAMIEKGEEKGFKLWYLKNNIA